MQILELESNDFRPDPDLEIGRRAELKDYKRSNYDRGHMAPQIGPGFNRGIWKVLEGKVRKWVIERGELYIVTGPIYVSAVHERTLLVHIGKIVPLPSLSLYCILRIVCPLASCN